MKNRPLDQPVRRPARRRGRPPGSVSLTDEIADKIVAYLRAGAFLEGAAEAAGISPRTLREWIERGEGRHPTRPCTPKLKAFASRVRQAMAEARIGAEVRVYRENPRYWLTHAAPSTLEREGWTTPPPGAHEQTGGRGENQLAELIRKLDEDQAPQREAWEQDDSCSVADCRCAYHVRRSNGERYPPELYGD